MAITYHKAINDSGGVIGDEIFSGNVGELLPEISLSDQLLGAIISRKFYIANDSDLDVNISNLSTLFKERINAAKSFLGLGAS